MAFMLRIRLIFAVFLVLPSMCFAEELLSMENLLSQLSGEFDNHEQVWQQDVDIKEKNLKINHPLPAIRQQWQVINHSNEEGKWFLLTNHYADKKNDPATKPQCQQIINISQSPKGEWIQKNYTLPNNQMVELDTQRKLLSVEKLLPRGEFLWQKKTNEWQLFNKERAIVTTIYGGGSALMLLQGNNCKQISQSADNQVLALRKVRYYEGWIAMPRKTLDSKAGEKDWIFMKNLRFNNAGARIAVKDNNGANTPYEVELAQLTYQNTRTPILVLKIFKTGESQALSYSWAATDSDRIGINLRWIQVGLTAE